MFEESSDRAVAYMLRLSWTFWCADWDRCVL